MSPHDTQLSELIINGFIDLKQDISDVRERLAVVETKVDERTTVVKKQQSRSAKAWGFGAASAIVGIVEALHKFGILK